MSKAPPLTQEQLGWLEDEHGLCPSDFESVHDLVEMFREYRGNSPAHWWAKAQAYGSIVHACTPALESAGYKVGVGDDGASKPIASAVEALCTDRDRYKQALEEILALNLGDAGYAGLSARMKVTARRALHPPEETP